MVAGHSMIGCIRAEMAGREDRDIEDLQEEVSHQDLREEDSLQDPQEEDTRQDLQEEDIHLVVAHPQEEDIQEVASRPVVPLEEELQDHHHHHQEHRTQCRTRTQARYSQ